LFDDIIERPFTFVGIRFNLLSWVTHLRRKHPNWSERQLRCCLYWQGKVRKRLREECKKTQNDGQIILYNPEANGVDVFKTCETIGIELERNPKEFVWKIAIIGRNKHLSGLEEFFNDS